MVFDEMIFWVVRHFVNTGEFDSKNSKVNY